MTKDQINSLLLHGEFPEQTAKRELVETHISWVFICDVFVYKIKKPVHYTFLDFSTLALRMHFCHREIQLNNRLTRDVYIDVQPVYWWKDHFRIGGINGTLVDYAVKMHKMDSGRQMDILLAQQKVTETHIQQLAQIMANFHQHAEIILQKDLWDIRKKFKDLEPEKEYLGNQLGKRFGELISSAMASSESFTARNEELLLNRIRDGYFRDCHGDLHTRNIFLLPAPVPFDCIEFNDDFRQIDVLNEVAFLCMDLDAAGRGDLSALFLRYYIEAFPAIKSEKDRKLFVYYKAYRANIRAKVNSLRAKSTEDASEKAKALADARKYLLLMQDYLSSL